MISRLLGIAFGVSLLVVGIPGASRAGAGHGSEQRPSAPVTLDGLQLTSEQVVEIASHNALVTIAPDAAQRVLSSHRLLMEAAAQGQGIYGLTVGVGLNKDQQMVTMDGGLSPEVLELSEVFNLGLIRAHSAGVPPEMPRNVVRALMVTRLRWITFRSPAASKTWRPMPRGRCAGYGG